MADRPRRKSMKEVATLVQNVNIFTSSLRRPRTTQPDAIRDEIIAATTRPIQRHNYARIRKNYVDEEGEEEKEKTSNDVDLDFEDRKRNELKSFYDRLIYNIPKSPKTTRRTAELAQPVKKNMIAFEKEYGSTLFPAGRRKRIKRRVLELSSLTTEELHEHFKKQNALRKDKEKIRKKRDIVYRQLLRNLQLKCKEKFMDDVFEKFSKYISHSAVALEGTSDISPQNVQRLVGCIEHNIYTTCKVTTEDRKANGTLYRSIAACITWIIVETLFIAQSVSEKERDELLDDDNDQLRKRTKTQNSLQRRAKLATNKKYGLKIDEKLSCKGAPPTIDELLKLSKLAGCR